MQLKIIKTKKDYTETLERFEEIFQGKVGTAQSDEADVLSFLIKTYEDKNFVMEAPSPLDAIKYRMKEQGLSNSDLASILGFKSRVTDLFNRNRKLNLKMIRKLNRQLQIPLETLVMEY